jgi:hypothetical protein
LLDYVIHRRIQAIEIITLVEDTEVTGLRLSADGRNVAGASVGARRTRGGSRAGNFLNADLVVDASGRRSRTPEWLTSLGFQRPEETVVDAHLG